MMQTSELRTLQNGPVFSTPNIALIAEAECELCSLVFSFRSKLSFSSLFLFIRSLCACDKSTTGARILEACNMKGIMELK